jgi:hypothetical protein
MRAPIEVLLALAVRLAMKLGIHEHVSLTSQQPGAFVTIAQKTEREMQRRLWWHILALDVQVAEYSGSDPTLWEGMWTCKMPDNVDDVELDDSSALPLPPRPGEVFNPDAHIPTEDSDNLGDFLDRYQRQTDMSYALLRIEMSYMMRQFSFSERFCKVNLYRYLSTELERTQALERHMNSINQRFLKFCTRNDMFSFFERNAVKLILSRHLMMMVKKDKSAEEVLHNAIMVLEAAASMRKTHVKWSWSLRWYVELDALEVLWRCLGSIASSNGGATGSLGTSKEEVDHGWVLGDIAFKRGEEDGLHRCYDDKWSRIRVTRDAALRFRTAHPQ